MDFYYLVCEESDGFKFPVSGSFSSSKEEVEEYIQRYRRDLYKGVEITKVSGSQEQIVVALVKGPHSLVSEAVWKLLMPDPNKQG